MTHLGHRDGASAGESGQEDLLPTSANISRKAWGIRTWHENIGTNEPRGLQLSEFEGHLLCKTMPRLGSWIGATRPGDWRGRQTRLMDGTPRQSGDTYQVDRSLDSNPACHPKALMDHRGATRVSRVRGADPELQTARGPPIGEVGPEERRAA